MLLPDRGEPDDGVTPGLIGPLQPRLPSIRDAEPPAPARTQKFVPPAQADPPVIGPAVRWARVAMLLAMFVILWSEAAPEWVAAALLLAVWTIPDRVLQRLIPKRLRQEPRVIQTDSGDTWITHVPSIAADADRNVRLPFRVMSGLIALSCMLLAIFPLDAATLFVRLTWFVVGVVFGAIALVPAGDLDRIIPRISTAPRLPAPGGDADAGERVEAGFQNSRSGLKIDG
ncbi:MAG TPA: hypothetical protein VGB15_12575 [Longimicrobium sp.]|jgi:hypothetical protein